GLDGAAADAVRGATLVLGIETALALFAAPLPAILRGRQRFDLLAAAALAQAAVGTVLLVVLTERFGLLGAAWSALGARLLVTVPLVSIMATRGMLAVPGSGTDARAVLHFAAPMWITAVAGQVGLMTDVPIVGAFWGDEAASAFALGSKLPGAGAGLLFAIFAASFPRLVAAPAQRRPRMVASLLFLACALAGAGFASLALHAPELLRVWVGTAPPLAVHTTFVYAATWFLHAPAHVLIAAAIALGRHQVLSAVVLVEAAANFALSLALGACVTPLGPAVATLVTLAISNCVVLPWLLLRRLDLRAAHVLRPIAAGYACGVAAAGAGALAALPFRTPLGVLAVAAPVALATTAAVLDLTVRCRSLLRWLAAVCARGGVPVLLRQAREVRVERRRIAAERASAPIVWVKDRPPLVTVRIATYRRGPLVAERAIASALRQTHRNLEILVVGDCCDEATARAVESVRDPRVRFVNLPERGRYPEDPSHRWMVAGAAPMNHALQILRGEWIAPLDDDDEFTDDHVEVLLDACRTRGLEFAWGKALVEGRDGAWTTCGGPVLRHGHIAHVAVLYSARLRRFLHDADAWRIDQPGDWNLWCRFRAAGVRMGFVDRIVAKHYVEMREVEERLPWWLGPAHRAVPVPAPPPVVPVAAGEADAVLVGGRTGR
ncbi:MAG TPA: glycosyltransferase, partial [Planctomycetota bacterium]|nr:glycosyltransferase [Planctomycetota bacterium]